MAIAGNEKETSVPTKRPIARPRTRSKFPLPSERFPFETHFEVLRQFVVRTKHGADLVSAGSVEGGTVPRQAASLNVNFLKSLGLFREENGKYAPTEMATKFVITRNASEERARVILRPIVENSWFGEFAKAWFATRPVSSEEEFVKELAIYAELSDMAKKELALKNVVAYLTYTQIVAKDSQGTLSWGATPMLATPPVGAAPVVPLAPRDEGPADWHTIQTEDFYLKMRSDPDVLGDLRAHLDLLEKKIARLRSRKPAVATPEGLEAAPIGEAEDGDRN